MEEANFSTLLTLSNVELVDLKIVFYIQELQVRQDEKGRKDFIYFWWIMGKRKGRHMGKAGHQMSCPISHFWMKLMEGEVYA